MQENPDSDNYYLIFTFNMIIGFVAVIGNSIILLIFLKFKEFRSQFSNVLISMLAFSDAVTGVGILLISMFPYISYHEPGTGYNRFIRCLISYPTCLGITWSQPMFIFLAVDRLMAVKLVHRCGSMNFKLYIIVIIIMWTISAGVLLYILCFTLPPTPSGSCLVGDNASDIFNDYFIISGLLAAITIFGSLILTYRI